MKRDLQIVRRVGMTLVTAAVLATPASTLRAADDKYDLTGQWHSNHGDFVLKRAGNEWKGSSSDLPGLVGAFTGKMEGQKLAFVWSLGGKESGRGTLSASDNGRTWSGPFKENATGKTSAWTMKRPLPGKPQASKIPNITGRWKSSFGGPVVFKQTGTDVTGSWEILDGISMNLTGQLDKDRVTVRMELEDNEIGIGALTLSSNQQKLEGVYQDKTKGTTLNWSLVRETNR